VAGRISQSIEPIGNSTRDLEACSAVPQPTASPRTPLFYENNTNYKKARLKQREGQSLHREIRFDSVNHTKVKVKVKILYVTVINLTRLSLFHSSDQNYLSYNFKYSIYHSQNINSYMTDLIIS